MNYMINGALEIVAYTFAMFIVERFGRRYSFWNTERFSKQTKRASEFGTNVHPALPFSIQSIFLPPRMPYATSLATSGTLLLSVALIPERYERIVVATAILGKFFITISFAIVYMFSTELFPTVLRTTGAGYN